APILPHQCRRLAQRATMGIARCGGNGADSSGDLFLAFATGNRGLGAGYSEIAPIPVQTLPNHVMTPLFEATADATEEAIVNALCAASTVTGIAGRTVHAIPLDRLKAIMDRAVSARDEDRD
ncbi:MAG: P1 family peptidase, partial [Chloroflexota bacterium]|nr:P1 family peptidase [Chloroflexota bacterium]